jgi:hypothetical protein
MVPPYVRRPPNTHHADGKRGGYGLRPRSIWQERPLEMWKRTDSDCPLEEAETGPLLELEKKRRNSL